VTRIWDHYLRDHPRARQLPAVIPLVVHHGRWAGPVRLLELIDLDPAARQAMQDYLPRFEFLLDDLADIDGRQLRDRKLTPSALITLLLLKTAPGNSRIPAELRPWARQLRAVLDQPGGGEAFIALLTYIELVVRDAGRRTARPGRLARPGRRGGVRDHRRDAPSRRRGPRRGPRARRRAR
jgi:hypothetical protein